MRSALLNILIIPVQALAWLGRQGTRAIAALVFIGIVAALYFVHARGRFGAARAFAPAGHHFSGDRVDDTRGAFDFRR